jgi:hypothetical protein
MTPRDGEFQQIAFVAPLTLRGAEVGQIASRHIEPITLILVRALGRLAIGRYSSSSEELQ